MSKCLQFASHRTLYPSDIARPQGGAVDQHVILFTAAIMRLSARFARDLRNFAVINVNNCLTNKNCLLLRRCYATDKLQWTSNRIRSSFIDYFKSNGHTFVKSSSILPENDESLRVVNAGMNQFKGIFLNTLPPGHPFEQLTRATNSQKCIRMGGKHNDLDIVGRDFRHHTFFEMLGNWSFGDYYKPEACQMAWTLLTDVWKLDKSRLIVTYFAGDQERNLQPDLETRDIWRQIGVDDHRIVPLGMSENFWEMADTGPCGPCTEIHYVIGDQVNQPGHELLRNAIEIWNLVFMEYNRTSRDTLEPLPRRHVDTGAGLERVASILQTDHKTSNYDTDLFQPLFARIAKATRSRPYQGQLTDPLDISYRILADHARTYTVAIADGLKPGKNRAPHKLRQIIKAANFHAIALFNQKSGKFVLTELAQEVARSLQEPFPEIIDKVDQVNDVLLSEVHLSIVNLEKAMIDVKNKACELQAKGSNVLTSEHCYDLFRSYGMTKEMLAHLAKQFGLVADLSAFDELHTRDKESYVRKKEAAN